MLRLVQLTHPTDGRRVAVVEEPNLRLLSGHRTVYHLAQALDYDAVYEGRSPWRLMVPFDHSEEPARCLVTGTGLTHKASAENRQSMHGPAETLTDSMKMYRIG